MSTVILFQNVGRAMLEQMQLINVCLIPMFFEEKNGARKIIIITVQEQIFLSR